ncbi:hypothetical protein N9W79_01035 [bacterium]|nr:hypothetical protein [bacterium]MDB2447186.1 hypothetical protein [bacterium]
MSKDSQRTNKPSSDIVAKNARKKEDLRKLHNKEIIQKMKDGDSLTSFDSMASWFPPRPTIEKNKEVMNELYAKDKPRSSSTLKTSPKKSVTKNGAENSDLSASDDKPITQDKKKGNLTSLREVK